MKELHFYKNNKSKNREVFKASVVILIAFLIFALQTSLIINIVATVFLAAGLYLIYRALKSKNTVTVSSEGIYSSVNGMGLIRWEHIKAFEIKNAFNARVLVVHVYDTGKLLDEMKMIPKHLMRTNIKTLGSAVIIPESEFELPLEEAKMKIENYKISCQ